MLNYHVNKEFPKKCSTLKQQEPVAANYLINSANNLFSEDLVSFKCKQLGKQFLVILNSF